MTETRKKVPPSFCEKGGPDLTRFLKAKYTETSISENELLAQALLLNPN
jgi:hypothetical protein